MNIHIHKAISDITGLTGMRIIRSILDGERNPDVLVEMRDPRIKCSKDELVQALQGDYRQEHLFTLRQALNLYEFYWQQIVECDKQIEACLTQIGENRQMPQGPTEACDADCSVDRAATKPRKKKRVVGT